VSAPKAEPIGAEALTQLTERLSPNQPCPVCRNRLEIGRGEPTAAVAVLSGETLVPQGRAMLAGMLTRVLRIQPREVFFLPVNRCKSHHGSSDDAELSCSTILTAQLSAVRPQLLLALGRDASRVLFSPQQIQIRRGHWSDYRTKHGPLPTLMTFHPNFLLQHPANKGHAFTDLKEFRARMDTL
jgi:uracil-DNA glycosylase family 4